MKKLLLSLTLLLCVGSAMGQTADIRMKKYKAMPNAKYGRTQKEGIFGLMGKGLLVAFDRKVKKDQMLKGIMNSNIIRF